MLGLLVVTHGRFAEELVNAAVTIVGELEAFEALSIGWNDQMDLASKELTEALDRVNCGNGVLVLTDMFGGTPTNLALSQMESGKVEIVTGVNLSKHLPEGLTPENCTWRLVLTGVRTVHE